MSLGRVDSISVRLLSSSPSCVGSIIEPIASRCAKFRFKSLPSLAVKNRISYICRTEGIEASDEVSGVHPELSPLNHRIEQTLEELNVISRGDMRGAINVLQSAELLLDEGEEVSPDSVREIAGVRRHPRPLLHELIGCTVAGNPQERAGRVLARVQDDELFQP